VRKCEVCNSEDVAVSLDNLSFSPKAEDNEQEWEYRLLRCHQCGLVYVDPKPSWQLLCSFYGSYGIYTSAGRDLFGGKGYLKYIAAKYRYATYARNGLLEVAKVGLGVAVEWITGRTVPFSLGIPLQLPKDSRIFEVGYGSGDWLLSMKRLGYRNLAGYDIDANPKNSSWFVSEGIDVSGGDFLANDYPEAFYDCIRMNHVLEHLLQPHDVLGKCRKMLAPGGVLALDSPCIESVVARLSFGSFTNLDGPRHLHHHTLMSARLLLESAGFDVVKMKPYGVLMLIPTTLNAILHDRGINQIKIPSFLFLPCAPVYKLFCLLMHKGEFQTILCRKRQN
jgi:SAM-dependent methyltransferase